MSADLSIRNARLVLPDEVVEGSLSVRGGKIAGIDAGGAGARGAEDFEGDYLLPGLVELHTDHLETHYRPRPGVTWDPMAAVQAHDAQVAGCGITTVFDALRAGTDDDADALGASMGTLARAIVRGGAESRLRAEHFIHVRCEISSETVARELEAYLPLSELRLVSLMDHTPGQRQFTDIGSYRRFYQRKLGLSDEEMDAFVDLRLDRHARYSASSRAAVAALCRDRGIVLASHDDAQEEHVREAVDAGVTISEFPTSLEAARAARRAGLAILMGAPNLVRGGSHSGNVAAVELARDRLLDILSSDYVPVSLLTAAMRLPDLVPGISLPRAVATVTRNPAAAVGMRDRGELAEGRRADLLRVRDDGGIPVVRGVWRAGRRVA